MFFAKPKYMIEYEPRSNYNKYEVYRNMPYFFQLFNSWKFIDSFGTLDEAIAFVEAMKKEPRFRYFY